MRVFHGEPEGGDEETYWLTTDRRHAAYFGDVTAYTLTLDDALVLDATRDVRLRRLSGYAADAKLRTILRRSGADAAIVRGWEGSGLVVLLARPI